MKSRPSTEQEISTCRVEGFLEVIRDHFYLSYVTKSHNILLSVISLNSPNKVGMLSF